MLDQKKHNFKKADEKEFPFFFKWSSGSGENNKTSDEEAGFNKIRSREDSTWSYCKGY